MFRVGLMRIKHHLFVLFVGFETGKDFTRCATKEGKAMILNLALLQVILHKPWNKVFAISIS
jgi:uncharacterized transporter YbjL